MSLDLQTAWDRTSAVYQRNQQHSADQVHYGPWAPSENELKLLGNLNGKVVLEIGCGGGQNCIAVVKQGGSVTGLDISPKQLRYAQTLAAQLLTPTEAQRLRFVQSEAEKLEAVAPQTVDLVLSVNTFQYICNISVTFQECWRVLRSGGRFIFAVDHPLRSCFIDEEADELAIYPIRSYFNSAPMRWQFPESGAWMVSYPHTIADWIDVLVNAGFHVQRLLEPPPPMELVEALWPLDGAQAELRHIPQTILFVAKKD